MTDHDINREGLGDALKAIAEQASPTPVADALQAVDQARAELLRSPDAYLGALENLADAVRSHGIGAELREQRTRATAVEQAEDNQAYDWSEPCDECGEDIPGGFGPGRHHLGSCSLYSAPVAFVPPF